MAALASWYSIARRISLQAWAPASAQALRALWRPPINVVRHSELSQATQLCGHPLLNERADILDHRRAVDDVEMAKAPHRCRFAAGIYRLDARIDHNTSAVLSETP